MGVAKGQKVRYGMDREVLFRAKRANNGEWVQGDLTHEPYGMAIRFYAGAGFRKRRKETIQPETVCQYAGMTDKNGVKIFEGDILSASLDDEYPEEITYVQVVWDGFSWCIKESSDCEVMTDGDCETFEVCGNVFDSPELLEVDGNEEV